MTTPARRTAPDFIDSLAAGEVIVVGTNAEGMHLAGAARQARDHFGLRDGFGEGLSGRAYALPTMEGPALLRQAVRHFIDYAERSPDLVFLLTRVGCGIAGYTEDEVAPLFADAPANVIRPAGWPGFDGTLHPSGDPYPPCAECGVPISQCEHGQPAKEPG